VYSTCQSSSFINPLPPTWVANAAPARAGPAPAPSNAFALAQQALSRAAFPGIGIGTNPPNYRTFVNVETFTYLTGPWRPITATASAGPVTSTVTATPTSVTWTSADGADDEPVSWSCSGPGQPYDPNQSYDSQASSACGHHYTWPSADDPSGTVPLSANVTWSVGWTSNIGQAGSLGSVSHTVGPVSLTVNQIEAVGAPNS
jgi:hypothetical protein